MAPSDPVPVAEEAPAPRRPGRRKLALAAGATSLLLLAGALVAGVLLRDGGKAGDTASGDRSGGSVTDSPQPPAGAGAASVSPTPSVSTTGKALTHPSAHTSPTGSSIAAKSDRTTAAADDAQAKDSTDEAGTTGSGSDDATACARTTGSGAITGYSACASSGTVTLKASFNTSESFYHAFFNTDGDTATGYQLPYPSPSALGADYMIENGVLYRSRSTSWKWTAVTPNPTDTVSGSKYTWTLPLSRIGSPTGTQLVEFNAGTHYTPVIAFSPG